MCEFVFKQALAAFFFQIFQHRAIGSYCSEGGFIILKGCHKQMIGLGMSCPENHE